MDRAPLLHIMAEGSKGGSRYKPWLSCMIGPTLSTAGSDTLVCGPLPKPPVADNKKWSKGGMFIFYDPTLIGLFL